jgi:hypothetical protein
MGHEDMAIRNLILEGFDEAIAELRRLRGEVAKNLPLPDGDSPDQLREMARVTMRAVSAADLIFNAIAEAGNLKDAAPDYVRIAIEGNLDFELRERAQDWQEREASWARAEAWSAKHAPVQHAAE